MSPLTNHSPLIALRLAFLCFLLFDVDLLFVRQPVGYVAFCTFPLQHLGHQLQPLRYQPPFRIVRARIAVALVVFIKTPINHIFFKSLIIPDYGLELKKTIYLNVFRNWNALCKSTRLYKSCSTPAGNKRKKTINTAFASQYVLLKNRVSDFWQVRLFFFY